MMKIFHLSDIHYSEKESENIRNMVRNLCDDLHGKVNESDYLVITGDLVWAGSDKESFLGFKNDFLLPLCEKAGFSEGRVILCPGNHDADSGVIGSGSKKFLYGSSLSPSEFDDIYLSENQYFSEIFKNYNDVFGVAERVGANYYYDFEDVSFISLNTSIFSIGGNSHLGNDDRRMVFSVSGLSDWFRERSEKKICLVLHHPTSWLHHQWSDIVDALIKAHVDFVFHGHEHRKDVAFRYDNMGGAHVFSAPALFSKDADRLGYCYVEVSGSPRAVYRQWSPSNSRFLVGVDFSGNDCGAVELGSSGVSDDEFISRLYSRNLDEALRLFSDSGMDWVDRRLSETPEYHSAINGIERNFISSEDIIKGEGDLCILAPPEYGLTSFGHHLCLNALDHGRLGYHLCLKRQRIFSKEIISKIGSELQVVNRVIGDLDFLVIDSWSDENVRDKSRAMQEIRKAFPSTRLIFLQTCNMASAGVISALDPDLQGAGIRKSVYLYALTRDAVRVGVKSYSCRKNIGLGNEDEIVSRVLDEFNFLNLPRTPLNCFTLLRILESNLHDNIMNRGDMVSRILSLVFSSVELPSYSRIPDVKDCEYIIGFFCANIIRSNKDNFDRDEFIRFCSEVCSRKLFDVDSSVMFEILYRNRIIIKSGGGYCFRFFYWVNYFAAMNMTKDDGFRGYILSSGGYISHPEIIEFYTGSDRDRNDALSAIKRDLDEAIEHLKEKVGRQGLFPYSEMKWIMSDEQQAGLADHLDREVLASKLPTHVKDEYSDRTYDPARPYYQTVSQVLGLTSMKSLMNLVRSAGKALRNSDFADVQVRLALLASFIQGMVQINRVLVLISSFLAKSGSAKFDDAGFTLVGDDWKEGFVDRQYQIIREVPGNLVNWYSQDIFSEKIGPLLSVAIDAEDDSLLSMYLVCMSVKNRPGGWVKIVEKYIATENKESFGLWAVFQTLRFEYRYGFHSEKTLEKMALLSQMCAARHGGAKKLGRGKIGKMKTKFLD